MIKILFYIIFLQWIVQLRNTQYTPRSDLKFINRNMIERPTTTKIDYSQHTKDPDSFWMGFFPIWAAILISLTVFCLILSLIGLFCWLAGCSNPRRKLQNEARILEQQQKADILEQKEQIYDDISMRMLDTIDKNSSNLFSDSKIYLKNEVIDSKIKRKKFRHDHL